MTAPLPKVYPIVDTAALQQRGWLDWERAARVLIDSGAPILQIRHKGRWTREEVDRAGQVAERCNEAGAPFVINDRADYAKLCGAWLHVGQEDLTPVDCRRVIGENGVIGFSTHNAAQWRAAAAEPVDYIAFGPVFPTASKLRADPVTGLELLRQARAETRRPLVAIGGITRAKAREVWDCGAGSAATLSIAVIGDLLPETLTEKSLGERMGEWLRLTRQ